MNFSKMSFNIFLALNARCLTNPEDISSCVAVSFAENSTRKMNKLIGRQRKPYYQMINTASKRVACIFIVIFIAAFTTIMSVSALRNAFKDFFMSWLY